MRNVQLVALRENYATLDKVLKLPNVAGPVVIHQRLHGLLRDALNALLHFTRMAQNKIVHQERNVFPPFAKGRDFDRKNIQSVKKVFSELVVE